MKVKQVEDLLRDALEHAHMARASFAPPEGMDMTHDEFSDVVRGCLRRMDLSNFKHLQPDERKVVKAKITEIMELLDEMDRLCK